MLCSIFSKIYNNSKKLRYKENAVDTLSAFNIDFEHELHAVTTVIQAQIDLVFDERIENSDPISRATILNRNLDRLVKDTKSLSVVSNLAKLPQSKEKVRFQSLLEAVAYDTLPEFSARETSLSFFDAQESSLFGYSESLEHMLIRVVLIVLQLNKALDIVTIVVESSKENVSLIFDSGIKDNEKPEFKRWQLGKLHLMATNGDGIMLSAVDAIARMHSGYLSISTALSKKQTFKLILKDSSHFYSK